MGSFCKKTFFLPLLSPGGFSQSVYSFPQRLGSPSGAQESSPRRQPWVKKAALHQPRKGRKKEALNLTNALRLDSPVWEFRDQQNSSEHSESAKRTEALVSEPREPVPANRPALIHSYVMEIRQGRQECLPCLNACRYLTPWRYAPLREVLQPSPAAVDGIGQARWNRCLMSMGVPWNPNFLRN